MVICPLVISEDRVRFLRRSQLEKIQQKCIALVKIRRERTQNVKYLSLDIYIKSNTFVEKQAKNFFLNF